MTPVNFVFLTIFLFITMIFFHTIADFNLQTDFMARYKQRRSWLDDEIGRTKKYKNDYKMCLLVHSFSWAFFIHIPIFIYAGFMYYVSPAYLLDQNELVGLVIIFILSMYFNTRVHYIIDDMKANQLAINLVQDQVFHLLQMLLTCIVISCSVWVRCFK